MIETLLTILALHQTWFHTNAPAHLFGGLHCLTLWRSKPGFWSAELLETQFKSDWFVWINSHPHIHPKVAELLTCPICFSWHISFWVVLFAYCAGLPSSEAWGALVAGVVACRAMEKL